MSSVVNHSKVFANGYLQDMQETNNNVAYLVNSMKATLEDMYFAVEQKLAIAATADMSSEDKKVVCYNYRQQLKFILAQMRTYAKSWQQVSDQMLDGQRVILELNNPSDVSATPEVPVDPVVQVVPEYPKTTAVLAAESEPIQVAVLEASQPTINPEEAKKEALANMLKDPSIAAFLKTFMIQ